MFVSVRKYRVKRGSAPDLARQVQESFVPLIRGLKGFRSYYLLNGGPDILISISVFGSADEALASNEAAAEWIRDHVMEFTKGIPDVMVGNAIIAEFL